MNTLLVRLTLLLYTPTPIFVLTCINLEAERYNMSGGGGDYDETISDFVENIDTGASFVLPSI